MNHLRFSDSFKDVNVKDVQHFMEMLWSDSRFKHKAIVVNNHESIDHGDTMITSRITFQVWKPQEIGKGTKYVWQTYRAKNFCCSNSSFVQVPVMEEKPVMVN
jgi:hypothetical protein